MSSHHIVRENQEPMLFVAGYDFSWKLLDELLEWSPLLIADEEAAEKLNSAGIKMDALLCASANLFAAKELYAHQEPITFVVYESESDRYECLQRFCVQKENNFLNVIGITNLKWKGDSKIPEITHYNTFTNGSIQK